METRGKRQPSATLVQPQTSYIERQEAKVDPLMTLGNLHVERRGKRRLLVTLRDPHMTLSELDLEIKGEHQPLAILARPHSS